MTDVTRIDEYLDSIIKTAESVRSALTPDALAAMGDVGVSHVLEAAKTADSAVGNVQLVIESPAA